MNKKVKSKFGEDLSEYPLYSDLDVRKPELERCDVCNRPTQKIEGNKYVQYRQLVKTGDDPDAWEKEWAWDFKEAKVLPAPEEHVICDRVRKIEDAIPAIVTHIGDVARQIDHAKYSSLSMRLRNRVGAILHRLGELVQR